MKQLLTQNPRTELVQDSFAEYASFPAVNNSALSLYEEARKGCPAKARHYMLNAHELPEEDGEEIEDPEKATEALAFGNLYHSFILDRPNFEMSTVALDEEREKGIYQQALVARYEERSQAVAKQYESRRDTIRKQHAKLKSKPDFKQWASGKLAPFEEWVKDKLEPFEEWIKTPPIKGFSKSMTEYKTWRAKIEADGRTIVDGGKLGMLKAMERGMQREEEIREALAVPKMTEVSIYWGMPLDQRDPSQGFVQCKARIDSLPTDGPIVDDLKTVRSGAQDDFARSIRQYGYDRQAAWYIRACKAVGLRKTCFRFITQEKTSPYIATLYELPDDWLQFAWKEVNATFFRMKTSIAEDKWPGYEGGTILPPAYLQEIIEGEASVINVGAA